MTKFQNKQTKKPLSLTDAGLLKLYVETKDQTK